LTADGDCAQSGGSFGARQHGTRIHYGTITGSLNLGANSFTVSADYKNANFGIGNSFNKLANVTTTRGQILAAGANPANIEVITGPKVSGGTSAPTLNLDILHVGDFTTYQIANERTAASPSMRGPIETDVSGDNITGGVLTGTGVRAANFGPNEPGTSSATYTVIAANVGLDGRSISPTISAMFPNRR
jgi:hypothetical protein